jgi:DNA-binding CsgD family transcriptional regulator
VSGLGLDAVAEAVYLTALTRVRWRIADLTRQLDLGYGQFAPGDGSFRPGSGPLHAASDRLNSDNGQSDAGGGWHKAGSGQPDPGEGRLDSDNGQSDAGRGRHNSGDGQLDPGDGRLDSGDGQLDLGGGRHNAGDSRFDLGGGPPSLGHSRPRSSDGPLNFGSGRLAAAVDQLRADGLLAASAEESGAVRAVDPALALPALAASRVWGLSAGDVRPQVLSIAQLIAHHRPPGPDQLRGLDEMNSFAEHLVANARREVVILSGHHRTGSFEFAAPIAEAVLRRGAQLRLVWRGELIRTPSAAAYATWLRTRGAAPRIVPTLPTTMLLVDRSVAMVVNGDDAVVNRCASSVAPLCVLADQAWGKSSSGVRRQQAPVEQTPRHHKVLRLLADGLTDDAIARQVGVSVRTVRNDMAAAMLSLDARSRFQAGVRAAQLGLL